MSYELKPRNETVSGAAAFSSADTLGLISLEPRILLDAAGFVTGAEVAMEAMAAEGADFGVQVIFENEFAAEPAGGPWLGEFAAEPAGGPWLGEFAAEPAGGPWLGGFAAEPAGGPWLGEFAAEPAGGPWLGEFAAEPAGGPWLGGFAAEPAGGPWL